MIQSLTNKKDVWTEFDRKNNQPTVVTSGSGSESNDTESSDASTKSNDRVYVADKDSDGSPTKDRNRPVKKGVVIQETRKMIYHNYK